MKRLLAVIQLIYLFVKEVTLSSIKVFFLILKRPRSVESDFFEIELKDLKDWQQILIAHFITLTPGTLSVDIYGQNKILIHILEKQEIASTKEFVENKLQKLVMDLGGAK